MADNPAQVVAFSSRGPTDGRALQARRRRARARSCSRRGRRMIAPNNQAWAGFPAEQALLLHGRHEHGHAARRRRRRAAARVPAHEEADRQPDRGAAQGGAHRRRHRLTGYGAAGAVVDNDQGFGRVNIDAVVSPPSSMAAVFVEEKPGLRTGKLQLATLTVKSGTQPLRVVLAWSDSPGADAREQPQPHRHRAQRHEARRQPAEERAGDARRREQRRGRPRRQAPRPGRGASTSSARTSRAGRRTSRSSRSGGSRAHARVGARTGLSPSAPSRAPTRSCSGSTSTPELADGLMGFAIERTDHTEGERAYLCNSLLFEANDKGAEPRLLRRCGTRAGVHVGRLHGQATARLHLQGHGDARDAGEARAAARRPRCTSRRGSRRRHARRLVQPRRRRLVGLPAALRHRGAAEGARTARRTSGSRAGSRRRWSRSSARPSTSATSCARRCTSSTSGPCCQALAVAAKAGADVEVVVHEVPKKGDNTPARNLAAIEKAGHRRDLHPRTKTKIAHNKFVVLLHDGKPRAGVDRLDEHHRGRHLRPRQRRAPHHRLARRAALPRVLGALAGEPERKRSGLQRPAPLFPNGRPRRTRPRSSARARSSTPLEWYCRLAERGEGRRLPHRRVRAHGRDRARLRGQRKYLRYLLLDLADRQRRDGARATRDNVVAAGGFKAKGGWRRWIAKGLTNLNGHVDYVHTKFMLVDPLGDDPIVVTGSANWSDESIKDNDENMLVIRGDTRVADIYLPSSCACSTTTACAAARAPGRRSSSPARASRAAERGKLLPARRRGLGGAVLRARLARGEGARALQLAAQPGSGGRRVDDGGSGTSGRGSASGGSAVARPEAGGCGGTA